MDENNMEITVLSKDSYNEITSKIIHSIVDEIGIHAAVAAVIGFAKLYSKLFNKKPETEETEKP